MPINRVRKKIHHLRRQPENVRLRAVSFFTLVSGVVLTILWVTVLLPFQLRMSGGSGEDFPEQVIMQGFNQAEGEVSPQVGGVRDEAPTPRPQLFHTAPPQPPVDDYPSSAPFNEESEEQQSPPQENYNNPSYDDEPTEAVPVEVTE